MSKLRILSHNAFWFQGAGFETDRPGPPNRPVLSALTEIYLRLKADVLALQEIQDSRTSERLARALRMSGRHCPGGELAQYGGATFWREGRFVADSRSSPTPVQRVWQMIEARSGSGAAVRICNVHLPSSRQLGEQSARRRRIRELQTVLDRPDAPAVILGDFNEQPGGPVGECLSRRGYLDAAVLTGRNDRPTSLGGARGDQVWIHNSLRDGLCEYAVLEAELLDAPASRGEALSDHLPLWVTLTT